jgi:hypothetical protein
MSFKKIFFSLVLVVGCGTIKPPNAYDCAVNTISGRVKFTCYNYRTDFIYDKDVIRLKRGAKPVVSYADSYEELVAKLNGGFFQSFDNRGRITAWRNNLWKRYQQGEFSCKK